MSDIAAVVIGRNEGDRLVACLKTLAGQASRVIYVDSGSTDGSPEAARDLGAEVVALDMTQPFTAARARNAGLAALADTPPDYVQLIDGDCTLQPGWIETAHAFLESHPKVAIACGRRREIHPEASVYNRLCDDEWNTPVGETKACGGDMLGRWAALDQVGGYNPTLIAGEEPDLCLRLRVAGWKIWRLDAEMTAHDADILRFGQWWKRVSRAGHAFAEGAWLHGKAHGHWVNETRRLLIWGLALPILALLTLLLGGWWGLLVLALYPVQVLRLARSRGFGQRFSWEWAFFLTLGKIPEALGALTFYRSRLLSRESTLIEYK